MFVACSVAAEGDRAEIFLCPDSRNEARKLMQNNRPAHLNAGIKASAPDFGPPHI